MAILNCFQKGTSRLQLGPSVQNSCPDSVLVLQCCHPGSSLRPKSIWFTFNFCTQMTYLHYSSVQDVSFIIYCTQTFKTQQLCVCHKPLTRSRSCLHTFLVNYFRQIKKQKQKFLWEFMQKLIEQIKRLKTTAFHTGKLPLLFYQCSDSLQRISKRNASLTLTCEVVPFLCHGHNVTLTTANTRQPCFARSE